MPNAILTRFQTVATFTLSLAPGGVGLADGSARQSTLISNTGLRPAAMIYLRIKSGAAAPTLGKSYDIFLLRGDSATPNYTSDNAGASDAAITILNSKLLGSILVTASATTNFYGEFDTSPLGPLGPYWGIAVWNNSGQAVDTTEANHLKEYNYYNPEAQ